MQQFDQRHNHLPRYELYRLIEMGSQWLQLKHSKQHELQYVNWTTEMIDILGAQICVPVNCGSL